MSFDPKLFYPAHPLLKDYVAYYYFLNTKEDFSTRYFAFPHTHSVLNLHLHATAVIEEKETRVFGSKTAGPISLIQGIRNFPLLATLQGELDKVTIIFKPMGINHFIPKNFQDAIKAPSQFFSGWESLASYQKLLTDFKEHPYNQLRAQLLEDFLVSVFQAQPGFELLKKATDLLTNFQTELTVEEIADVLHVSSRTLNRLFQRHLGVSPVAFKKVARFRHSLANQLLADQFKRLTDIAYQSNFYDQAYFNKIYRSFTGTNPQQFFKQINHLADDQLIFHFTKR